MTSVNLDKLNNLLRKIIQANVTLNEVNEYMSQLENETSFALYSHYPQIQVDDAMESVTEFILRKYQEAVCPNLDLSFLHRDIRNRFHNMQYNCYNVVEFINEKIGDSTERLAYNQLLKGALYAVKANEADIDLSDFISEHTQKSREIILKGCHARGREFVGYDSLAVFEKFVNLILLNAGLFHRTPPSQMQFSDISDFMRARRPELPCKVPSGTLLQRTMLQRSVKSMSFYKRGRVDVEFFSTGDMLAVSKALCGIEPKIYFPKSSAKPEDIFDARPDGRIKRVVKMEGVCGISEENK